MKKCSTCKENKDLVEFSKNVKTPDGHRYQCRTCSSAYMRGWRAKNAERLKTYRESLKTSDTAGVYVIYAPEGIKYFGSTTAFEQRKGVHLRQIRREFHENPTLRALSKKYSENDFQIELLEEINDADQRASREACLIAFNHCCNEYLQGASQPLCETLMNLPKGVDTLEEKNLVQSTGGGYNE